MRSEEHNEGKRNHKETLDFGEKVLFYFIFCKSDELQRISIANFSFLIIFRWKFSQTQTRKVNFFDFIFTSRQFLFDVAVLIELNEKYFLVSRWFIFSEVSHLTFLRSIANEKTKRLITQTIDGHSFLVELRHRELWLLVEFSHYCDHMVELS